MDPQDGWSAAAGGTLSMRSLLPDVDDVLRRVQDDIWDAADPELLELARLRIGMLLGARSGDTARPRRAPELAPERVDNLRAWPTSPLYSDRERACLGLTEQFVMDVAGVTDDDVAAAAAWMSPAELYGFVSALYVLEFSIRVDIATARLTADPAVTA
jgi:alkylhydroperoxidase family enzyme